MKKDYKKVFEDYSKLDERGKIQFKNILNRDNERQRLEDLSLRSSVANQLLNDLITTEGKPYLDIDWVAKNILGFTEKELKESKAKKSK